MCTHSIGFIASFNIWRGCCCIAILPKHFLGDVHFLLKVICHRLDCHWCYIIISGVACYMMSGWGITAGAHRLWAHRSYKAKLPLRIILAMWNSMAFQVSSQTPHYCPASMFWVRLGARTYLQFVKLPKKSELLWGWNPCLIFERFLLN